MRDVCYALHIYMQVGSAKPIDVTIVTNSNM
jgi:hypothetical protein